jgi:hypothetical protein
MTRTTGIATQLILGIVILLYAGLGILNEAELLRAKPPDRFALEDFRFYERALGDTLAGRDPYAIREIGPAYLYPPPALFLVESFAWVPNIGVKWILFSAVNIALLIVMVSGIARLYQLPLKRVWYWYVLALAFAPFLELLHIGQINIFTGFGIFLLYWGEQTLPIVAGLGLALAVITKVSPLILVWYLLVQRRFRVLLNSTITLAVIIILGVVRYGWQPLATYPQVFLELLDQRPNGIWSHTFFVKLNAAFQSRAFRALVLLIPALGGLALGISEHSGTTQRVVMIYLFALLGISGILTYLVPGREALFILSNLVMVLSSNILWYHHYVLILLPFFILMAWARLDPRIVAWCIFSLLVIQIDRWNLTRGVLIQLVLHLTVLGIFAAQLVRFKQTYPSLAVPSFFNVAAKPGSAESK